MSLFSTKVSEISEERKGGGNQDYIYPGIKNAVTIHKVETGAASTGTPFIELFFHTKEKGEDSSKGIKLYISPKNADNVLIQLTHMATKVTTRADFNARLKQDTIEELAASYAAIMRGKYFRMKFNGEQYVGQDGKVKDNAKIPYSPEFAEAIMTGAEYAPVADDATELTFSKDNQYDYKKLSEDELPTEEESLGKEAAGGIDDLA